MRRGSATLYAAVMVGSGLGALLRYLLTLVSGPGGVVEGGLPWATLAANVVGSFVIGLFATLTDPDGRWFVGPATRQFVMVGVCGGLTTFSVFSLETVVLASEGRPVLAAGYVAASLALWIPSAWSGHALAEHVNRLPTGGRRPE